MIVAVTRSRRGATLRPGVRLLEEVKWVGGLLPLRENNLLVGNALGTRRGEKETTRRRRLAGWWGPPRTRGCVAANKAGKKNGKGT